MEVCHHNFSKRVLLQVGAFFLNQRLQKGLSIDEVAGRAGLDSSQLLVDYENGRRPVPSYEIFKIADAIGISERLISNMLYDIYLESALLGVEDEDHPLHGLKTK
jgi:transcriptional regulator with XRE-family HTH domain